ncbi:MAG: hypothetical protein LBT88_06255 [Oscillospiraceae bacterium]|jgi:histidinol phosphatase-like enzyme|nr:hypothetical protein [Oscillospiraceae bacterium]
MLNVTKFWRTLYSGGDSDTYHKLMRILTQNKVRFRARYYDKYSEKISRKYRCKTIGVYFYVNENEAYKIQDESPVDPANGYVIEIRRKDIERVKELLSAKR